MIEYDVIAFGTGSSMNIVSEILHLNPDLRVAVIENGPVGGICLTRGCIPSKTIIYPAKLLWMTREADRFGIQIKIGRIDFRSIVEKTYNEIMQESREIEESLKRHPRIDLYKTNGEFVGDYMVKVGNKIIKGEKILLGIGSRPLIPPITGLEEVGYLTSDNFFEKLREPPRSMAIIGGGFIGLELGFFLAMMGTKVTIIEQLPRIAYGEEPEVSALLQRELSRIMGIYTGYRVAEAGRIDGRKRLFAESRDGRTIEMVADEILVAAGRRSNADITKPEKTGVEVDRRRWIITNEYLETMKPNIWAFGDANGKYLFKHKANYESKIVFHNAFLGDKIKAEYHAIPHAIFTEPEVASVGLRQSEAEEKFGGKILVGYYRYEKTAMGKAMGARNYFVKVIVKEDDYQILGAHIIGYHASILLQEIVNLMYTNNRSAAPIFRGMHIHPALSEVVERAFYNLRHPVKGHPEEI